MSKVRINDLARELEVKSRPILDALEAIGVTGKTHASSIEEDQAERVRAYFNGGNRGMAANRPSVDTKPKFDLSKVSKPGDALKAILERKQAEEAAKYAPPVRPQAVVVAPPAQAHPPAHAHPAATAAAAGTAPRAGASAAPAAAPAPETVAPRRIVPLPRQGANIVAPAPTQGAGPAIANRPPMGAVVARPPAGTAPVVADRPGGGTPPSPPGLPPPGAAKPL